MPDARRFRTVATLGSAQTLAWASSYYLPAVLAAPMARDLGVGLPTVFAVFSWALIVSALLGPHAGRAIDQAGGRPVLIGTNLVFAAGLALLGWSESLAGLVAAWTVIGVAMGAGLYDAAFAAIVRLHGRDSRGLITGITLVAGFASTVGWPLSALMESQAGWRNACFGWALLHLVVGLPLNAALPRIRTEPAAAPQASAVPHAQPPASPPPRGTAALLAFVFASMGFTATAMATHFPTLMQMSGASLAAAVAAGALIGPAQVGARVLEFGLMRRIHPLWSARMSALAHPLGAGLLLAFGAPLASVFALVHGAGNGILTIAKGTLPLALFGPQGYGARQGLLMLPARVTQALAPWLFGWCLELWGPRALLVSGAIGFAAAVALLRLRAAS
jgi:predicted MFS family arabinose efflux permease